MTQGLWYFGRQPNISAFCDSCKLLAERFLQFLSICIFRHFPFGIFIFIQFIVQQICNFQACRGYEISYPYPYPQIFRGYPWIYPWIFTDIFISTDAYSIHAAPNFRKIQQCKSVYLPAKHDTDIPPADGEDLIILPCTVFDWSTRVTDGHTDGQTELRWLRRATAVAAVARKK